MTWDMNAAIEAAHLNESSGRARKLSFYDQCQIFAAVHKGRWKRPVVAEAFGVSKVSVAQIGACLTSIAAAPRYRSVRSEFSEQGEDEFNRLYYTEALHNKLTIARHKLRTASLTK